MKPELRARLEELAARGCWLDDPEFVVDDYAGGNIDDAFAGGERSGETNLAREILAELDA